MSRSHSLTLALLIVALGSGVASWAAGPADPLLRLVPTDVGLTFALEDLQGHARTTFRTPLIEGLSRLPAVEAWRQSDDFRGMRRSIAKLEAVLGADFARIRDGLLGEAVVLTLRLPAGAGPDAARGLLLARVPDRPLLDRLIRGVNDAQLKEGVLHNVAERKIGEVAYHVREFGGRQPDEYYVVLEGAIFAWSNSEDLVREVIDRREKGGGLGETETFRTIRAGLPERALLSAYVEAGFARRVLAAAPRPDDARGERLAAVVGRYLGAVRYAGAALAWDDGPVLHTHEALDPTRLPSAVKKWASRTGAVDPRLSRVSASTFALATIRGDSLALLDLFRALTPEPERPRVENFIVALQGMMLGLDLRDELAPQLGPGWSLAVDVPESGK
ncbi:MAG: hypothetical protein U0835_27845, partial [Isosphaeraceae bacterium]